MEIKEHTNLIIVGNWNINILTPDWFIKQFPDKIKHKQPVPVEFSLGTGVIRFTIENIIIQPTSNRLDLITTIEDVNHYNTITDFAIGIVEKLPHTPISAIGHNIAYYLTTERFKYFNEDQVESFHGKYNQFIKKVVLNSQQIRHSLEFEDYILNLTYDINRKKSYIDFNFHYTVTEITKANDYIMSFKDNISSTAEIFKELVA
ncbi:hypothetical protein ES703_114533 [subsurface metagenome]